LRIKKRERVLTHPAPQEGFGFQDSEFPSPFRARILESLTFSMGFVLTLFQVPVQESVVSMIESSLRAVVTAAAQPAANNYGEETYS
jgi:hypothetical protein